MQLHSDIYRFCIKRLTMYRILYTYKMLMSKKEIYIGVKPYNSENDFSSFLLTFCNRRDFVNIRLFNCRDIILV